MTFQAAKDTLLQGSGPQDRTPPENGQKQEAGPPAARGPTKECDLVMKGGITSGIAYPPAVLQLKNKYRFNSIGGASVGAIAAAATAAAEFGRENGGFDRLQSITDWLSRGKNLLNLFGAPWATRPALNILIDAGLFGGARVGPVARCFLLIRGLFRHVPGFSLLGILLGALVGLSLGIGWGSALGTVATWHESLRSALFGINTSILGISFLVTLLAAITAFIVLSIFATTIRALLVAAGKRQPPRPPKSNSDSFLQVFARWTIVLIVGSALLFVTRYVVYPLLLPQDVTSGRAPAHIVDAFSYIDLLPTVSLFWGAFVFFSWVSSSGPSPRRPSIGCLHSAVNLRFLPGWVSCGVAGADTYPPPLMHFSVLSLGGF